MKPTIGVLAFVMLVATGALIALVTAPFGLAVAGAAAQVAFGWSSQVVGSGDVVTEPRTESPFHRISTNGSTDVRVAVGGQQSVVVEAQRNIADIIDTTVEDGTLFVSSHKSYTTNRNPLVRITLPNLDGVDIKGSSNVVIDGARGPSLDMSIRGSGELTAAGSVGRLTYNSFGSGDASLRRLAVRDAVVRIRGSGNAELNVSGTLDVEVSGSGDVRYGGSPRVVHQSIRGSGNVSHD